MKFWDKEFDLSYSIEQKEMVVKCKHSFLQIDGPLADDVIRDNEILDLRLLDKQTRNINKKKLTNDGFVLLFELFVLSRYLGTVAVNVEAIQCIVDGWILVRSLYKPIS